MILSFMWHRKKWKQEALLQLTHSLKCKLSKNVYLEIGDGKGVGLPKGTKRSQSFDPLEF